MSDIPVEYKSKTSYQARAHIIEECGEVLAAYGKSHRFGLYSYNPELSPDKRETNISWFERELADLERAIAAYREFQANN